MMQVRIATVAVLLNLFVVNSWAEEFDPDLVFGAALENDLAMKSLLLEKKSLRLNAAVEDYEKGVSFSTGFDDSGTSIQNIGESFPPGINAQPYAECVLPESTGTTIRADMPLTGLSGEDGIGMAAKISVRQNVNSLLGIKPQEKAKALSREMAERDLDLRIWSRKAEIERDVLELIKSLLDLEMNLIAKKTDLDEKGTLLSNMLNAGMIAMNSSNHLSKLMEIRELESSTEELKSGYAAELAAFGRLTGINISESPRFPVIGTLALEPGTAPYSIKTSELNLDLQKAKLEDYVCDAPPKISINAGGQTAFASPGPEIFGGMDVEFDDLSLSVKGVWNDEGGLSLSAGMRIGINDDSVESLNKEILENNIDMASLSLGIARQEANDAGRGIVAEISRIESEEEKIRLDEEFIKMYLREMEIKQEHGLVRETELVKARDQEKIVRLKGEILNIDRYLLQNTIAAQMERQ